MKKVTLKSGAMMEHTYIHEPTEVSFHDMSDIGAENILDLSNIQRDSVSPAEPFVPSSPSIMSDGMRDPYDPPIITSVQVHTATSPSVHDPYDPPIISMRPNNVHVQEPSVDPRRLQPTTSDSEQVVGKCAPSTSTPLQKLCSVCGAHVLKRNYIRHYKSHFDIQFKCSACSMYFETQQLLDSHNALRHSQNQICPYCGKCYIQKSALNEHTRIKHEGSAKMAICNICNKQFHRVGHLQDHLNTHYGRATHKCPKCKNAYHNSSSLKRHTKDCDGKAKECTVCKRKFSSGNTLRDHQKSEHGGKVYACECGNAYKWRAALARHRKNSNHKK